MSQDDLAIMRVYIDTWILREPRDQIRRSTWIFNILTQDFDDREPIA